MNTAKHNIKVLVAPLDWGLGHATRCIPIIHALLSEGYEVILAGECAQAALLQSEFPQLPLLPLKGYRVTYSKHRWLFPLKILLQLPRIWKSIQAENKWLCEQVKKHSIRLIIADNRYGLHHKGIPSVFITHQLCVQAPFQWMEKWIQQIQYRLIQSFTECWVPDGEGEMSAAGKLSHPEILPSIPTRYIGWLCRLQSLPQNPKFLYTYCVVLSGPEPQRSCLEEILLAQLSNQVAKVVFIRGLPNVSALPSTPKHITCYNHLDQQALSVAFSQSEWIVSRSGYTTIMEILCLQKKSILIPTPGQTEQMYLAKKLQEQKLAYTVTQEKLDWHITMLAAAEFPYRFGEQIIFQPAQLPLYLKNLLAD